MDHSEISCDQVACMTKSGTSQCLAVLAIKFSLENAPYMVNMLQELHPIKNILVFSNMNVHSHYSPGQYSSLIVTGPFSLIQS